MYKVMIVDDEPLILKGLRAIIDWQQLGLQITSQAASGEQAMEAFLEEETDIIITDIRMPGMSGLELIETVRSIDPGVKFIVLSGYDDFQYVKEGMKYGIENYLLKPIDVEELEATLRAVIVKLANVLQQQLAARKEQQILRDNILIRWVTQTISPLELKQRSELIGVPLGGGSFAVAVCGVMQPERQGDGVSDEVRMEYVSEAHGTLQSILGSLSPSVLTTLCFVDLDGDIGLVCQGKGAELDRSVLQAELGEVMSQLRESLGVDVFLSIGITVQSFTKVHESYEHAKNLQTRRLINSRQSILDGAFLIQNPGEERWFLSCFVDVLDPACDPVDGTVSGKLQVNTNCGYEIYLNGSLVPDPEKHIELRAGLNRLIAILQGSGEDIRFGLVFKNAGDSYMKHLQYRLTLDEVEPK